MSSNTTEGNQSCPHESRCTDEKIDALFKIVERQSKEIEKLREKIDDLQEEGDDDGEEIEQADEQADGGGEAELSERVEENTARIDALSTGLTNVHDEIAELRDETDEIEAELSGGTPTPQTEKTTLHDTLTPIERLSSDEMDLDEVTDSPYARRAVALFENIRDWGKKTPKGYVLRPAENPLSLLETATGESLCWKQYYRTAEMLERLSKGSITFFDSDRHGKMICLHQKSEMFERVTRGVVPLSSSSAGGGGESSVSV